jgi:hypothetical protein
MAKDWINKLINQDKEKRKTEADRLTREVQQKALMDAKWPAFANGLREELTADVNHFNTEMAAQRSDWVPFTISEGSDSISILDNSPDAPTSTVVTLNPTAHTLAVKHVRAWETETQKHFEVEVGSGGQGFVVYEIQYHDRGKSVPSIAEFILRPMVQRYLGS